MFRKLIFIGAALVTGLIAGPASATTALPVQPIPYASNGAWCWFNNPRAIERDHITTFASMSNTGEADLTQLNHITNTETHFTVATGEAVDDHSVPSVTFLGDGRIIVFWTQHSVADVPVRYRVSRYANEITNWGPVHTLPVQVAGQTRYAYPDPVVNRADGRLYLFWRAGIRPGVFAVSWTGLNDLVRWEPAHVLMRNPDGVDRPYWDVDYDDHGGINIVITDGNPNEVKTNNNVYFANLRHASNGKLSLYTTTATSYAGRFRHYVSDGAWNITSKNLDVIQHASIDYNGWLWDLAHSADGNPIVASVGLASTSDQYARYIAWRPGVGWVNRMITDMGGTIATPTREPNYSPGIAIDHHQPSQFYIATMTSDGHREISQYTTTDYGQHWAAVAVTENSAVDNVRPVVPRGAGDGVASLLWMAGTYTHWTVFGTEITGDGPGALH